MGLFRMSAADTISAIAGMNAYMIKAMMPCPSTMYYPAKGGKWYVMRCVHMSVPEHDRHMANDARYQWTNEDAAFMLAQYNLITAEG